MSAPNRPVYSIGAVAHMLNMPQATLRAWEERYAVVVPARGEGTHRLYSRAQVEQLRFVKSQIDAGMSAADAHRLLQDELAVALAEGALPDGVRPLVLIAERDPYAARLAEHLLTAAGCDVRVAYDAAGARGLFVELRPEVVVVDLLISGGAGAGLCREFAAAGAGSVLAMSALDSAEQAGTAGASAFLRKPLEPPVFLSVVRELLDAASPAA